MAPVATCTLSGQLGPVLDFFIHVANLLNVLYYGQWEGLEDLSLSPTREEKESNL